MIPGSIPGEPRTPPAKCPTVGGRATGGFLQYAQLLNPRNSMSITNTKGLLNMPGQNNCFLNSAVQVLWHLDIFRRSFRELCGHACMEDSCIFCALKELFAQFQYSQESALPPDALRRALAETFCDQRRFQLGFMDDAAECFENILMRIHFHIANNESEDMCSALHCIPHQKFAMTLVEQTVCHACGATSEPLPFTQMVHYVPSSALCSQAKLMKEKSDQMPSFSELLKRAGGLGDLRDCPSSCGAAIQIRKTLMNRPEIVSIGLVWDSERPTIEHIMDVFKTIGMSLKLQDVFHSVVDSRWASTATHQLVGIVTYYGKHYSTFFFHTKLRVWIYFDDAAVREIGPKWEQVVEKCCRGHFQPLLLLYANPHGSPVNTSTAPRVITVVPGHKKSISAKDSCNMISQHDKNPRMISYPPSTNQRRALTPNPEASCDITASIQPRRAVTPSGELSWSDESTNKTSHKDNSTTFNIRNSDGFDSKSLHKPRNSEQVFSPNGVSDGNDPSKQSRVSARLSVPNCSYFSDIYQQRPLPKHSNIILNRPASVEDILKSSRSTNVTEAEKVFCQLDENIAVLTPDELTNDSTYISRKAVENVLHLQKLQRQRSITCRGGHVFIGQRNSSSSLESLDNVFLFRDKGSSGHNGSKLEFSDVMNIARRRDSGNWSGDRSSASSSSTTSLDNPYLCALGKRLPNCSRTVGRTGDTTASADLGYDSFSLSSSDSYPSAINCSSGKLGQIPEHVQTAFMPYDLSQLQYCLKDLKNNDHFPFGFKDDCDKLCAEADIFVAKSIERENAGDISMAALLSDTAAAKARAAMDVPYTSSQALAMAKMKHSMCLIRSSNLHKKIKEAEAALCRKPKETIELSHNQSSNSVVNKNHSDIAYKNSKEETETVSNEISKDSKRNIEEQTPSDKNIEIYATLPKRSLKKKGALSSFVESLTGEESSDERSIKDKTIQKVNEESKSEITKSDTDHEKSSKSSNKKKGHSQKPLNKESDLSDYSSEWEHTKKQSLYRTYSGPTNSKNELSDFNANNNQTFNEHPSKKQHRIRRKLMGGFMRRKNRSLPDLREGQDSGSETARSFDDCFFTQTPVTSRKKQDIKNIDSTTNSNHQDLKKSNKSPPKPTDGVKQLKKSPRTHTPPPYKPPPPITHSNSNISAQPKRVVHHLNQEPAKEFSNISTQPKRIVQHSNQEPAKEFFHSNHVVNMPNPQELLKPKNLHHPPLCRDIKNHRKVSVQYMPHEHSASNNSWLKELQMKQEELNQRKKLQEERERWLTECSSGISDKSASPQTADNIRDISFKNQSNSLDEKEQNSTNKTSQRLKQISNPMLTADVDHLKSVRDIASKFEKSTVVSNNSELMQDLNENSFQMVHSATPMLSSSVPVDNKIYMGSPQKTNVNVQQLEHMRLHPSLGHRTICQVFEKSPLRESDSSKNVTKDRLNGVNGAKQVYSNQSTSGSVYSPHLTDAQLTNVLRIGGNRSSFRNSNGHTDMQDETFARFPYVLHEAKRPDKPPDYETAIQRLELLRNDRNLTNFYAANNCMSFEALLEQAKKRRGPKKSVTFSDKVVLVACAGDEDNDFIPNPLLERVYKQHFMQSSQPETISATNNEVDQNLKSIKDGSNTEISSAPESAHHLQDAPKSSNQSPCHLCHKKTVDIPNLYCPDCAYYMSRFQQK